MILFCQEEETNKQVRSLGYVDVLIDRSELLEILVLFIVEWIEEEEQQDKTMQK